MQYYFLFYTDSLLSLFRFEIEIEPIFASLALYDVKEKKKVSFYVCAFFFNIYMYVRLYIYVCVCKFK